MKQLIQHASTTYKDKEQEAKDIKIIIGESNDEIEPKNSSNSSNR